MIALLRFCPSCGGHLPATGVVKYCPACGTNLAAFVVASEALAAPVADLPATTYAAALRRYDQYIADLRAQGLDPEEIRRRAADMFAKLKAQFPARPRPSFAVSAAGRPADEPRSIILKTCVDRERLAGRLSRVLRRSPAAVRLAADMVPCVIVYKSKAADIQAAISILDDENLYYTVIQGEFDANTPLEKIIPGFAGLDANLQLVCRSAPAALWLGEDVRLVAPAAALSGAPAVLAVADRALFLCDDPGDARSADWRIIPYARLAGVVLHDGDRAVELVYRDAAREEWLRLADDRQCDRVYDHIRRAIEAVTKQP